MKTLLINGRVRTFEVNGNLFREVYSDGMGAWNRMENVTDENIIKHYSR